MHTVVRECSKVHEAR